MRKKSIFRLDCTLRQRRYACLKYLCMCCIFLFASCGKEDNETTGTSADRVYQKEFYNFKKILP
jgi:major membrane immunogen (membrane-anchored lipoprotein)